MIRGATLSSFRDCAIMNFDLYLAFHAGHGEIPLTSPSTSFSSIGPLRWETTRNPDFEVIEE
jgi:hypothetical protein